MDIRNLFLGGIFMINLMTLSDPMYTFDTSKLKENCDYDVRVGNITKTYKWNPPYGPVNIDRRPAWLHFTNIFRKGNRPEFGEPFEPHKHYKQDIGESLSIDAMDYVDGDVRIKEHDSDHWFTVDELVITEREPVLDDSKIFPGQIWSLTIDGDPRFNNTIIQIASVTRWELFFNFQRKVVYGKDFERVELVQGKIDYKPQKYNKETKKYEKIDFDFNKVHLDILMNKDKPTETIDRSQPDKYVYPYPHTGWSNQREDYPFTEFKERKPYPECIDKDYDD
jgi:hypothetical protein